MKKRGWMEKLWYIYKTCRDATKCIYRYLYLCILLVWMQVQILLHTKYTTKCYTYVLQTFVCIIFFVITRNFHNKNTHIKKKYNCKIIYYSRLSQYLCLDIIWCTVNHKYCNEKRLFLKNDSWLLIFTIAEKYN